LTIYDGRTIPSCVSIYHLDVLIMDVLIMGVLIMGFLITAGSGSMTD
jgi:hypothetical protein